MPLARLLLLMSVVAYSSLSVHSHFLDNRMNISEEEYTRSFNSYVRRIREKDSNSSYAKKYFLTLTHSDVSMDSLHSRGRLQFEGRVGRRARVERATLRALVSGENCRQIRLFQVGESGDRRQLETVLPDPSFLPQWRGVEAELSGATRFELEGPGCRLSSPALHLLVERVPSRRRRSPGGVEGSTDCRHDHLRPSAKRQRCCRHKMDVVFKELPGYEFILHPTHFDAGYCKGTCPYSYNPASHHASLQGLIYKHKKGPAPRPCCAPSKLEQLEIVHVDEDDVTKLQVTTWSNMKVIECACS